MLGTAIINGTNNIAKHGYKVKGFGFFFGTCQGSDRLPMEQERSWTDSTCDALLTYANGCDADAGDLARGEVLPARICVGQERTGLGKYVDKFIPFAEGTDLQKSDTVKNCIWAKEQEARQARSYRAEMIKLVAKVHGTALIDIVAVAAAAKVAKANKPRTKVSIKEDLDKLQRQYEALRNQISEAYLAQHHAGKNVDDVAGIALYYGAHSLAHWNSKCSATARRLYPELAGVVTNIEMLTVRRAAVKAGVDLLANV